MKIDQFPKEIYITIEGDPGEQFFNATKTPNGLDDGTKVGVYQLVAVKRQKVTETLV